MSVKWPYGIGSRNTLWRLSCVRGPPGSPPVDPGPAWAETSKRTRTVEFPSDGFFGKTLLPWTEDTRVHVTPISQTTQNGLLFRREDPPFSLNLIYVIVRTPNRGSDVRDFSLESRLRIYLDSHFIFMFIVLDKVLFKILFDPVVGSRVLCECVFSFTSTCTDVRMSIYPYSYLQSRNTGFSVTSSIFI